MVRLLIYGRRLTFNLQRFHYRQQVKVVRNHKSKDVHSIGQRKAEIIEFYWSRKRSFRPKPKVNVQKYYNCVFIAKFCFVPNPIYLQYPQVYHIINKCLFRCVDINNP